MGILLKEVLKFEDIRAKGNTIRLRFNNDWWKEDKVRFVYTEYYLSDKKEKKEELENNLLTYKGNRMYTGETVIQFINIGGNRWLLIDVIYVITTEGSKINNRAEVKHLTEYDPFIGRVIVKKPKDKSEKVTRTWTTNNIELVNKTEIIEILSDSYRKVYSNFYGFEHVSKSYNDLKNVIDEPMWKQALSSVYGVYVITDTGNGNLYIGSATGTTGIYGRWKTYIEKGYDEKEVEDKDYPNKKLKEIANDKTKGLNYIRENFQYSILEIFTKNKVGANKALEREKYWKKVFDTKEHGYNDN